MTSAAPPAPARPLSLRRKFTRAVLLAALLPAVGLGVVEQMAHYRAQQQHLRDRVEVTTVLSAAAVDEFVQSHLSGVLLVARLTPADADWTVPLSELRDRYPAFISVLATDAEGNVPLLLPQPPADAPATGVRDRAYFNIPRVTGRPFVSNAFVGRRLGNDPLVAVSAPIERDGRFAGVVEGSIRVDAFTSLRAASMRRRGMGMLILDRQHQVIHASEGLPFRFMQRVDDVRFAVATVPGQRVSAPRRMRGAMADGRDAWVSQATLASGWTLVVFAPDDVLRVILRERTLGTLGVLLLVAGGVWLAYAWQMGRFNRALQRLLDALKALATHQHPDAGAIGSLPEEFQPLGQAIGRLSVQLEDANRELERSLADQRALSLSLQHTLEQREQEIQARIAELRQANAELDRLNRTDPLTGCLNRRGLQHRLTQWSDEMGRLQEPVAMIAIDVDCFKAYNDRYGHAAGDATLRRVAGMAASMLRSGEDALARMGGEEFLMLLHRPDEALAEEMAERVRSGVQALGIAHDGSPWGVVTVSVGLVHGLPGMDYAQVFLVADEALYRAKHGGRNRVECD